MIKFIVESSKGSNSYYIRTIEKGVTCTNVTQQHIRSESIEQYLKGKEYKLGTLKDGRKAIKIMEGK